MSPFTKFLRKHSLMVSGCLLLALVWPAQGASLIRLDLAAAPSGPVIPPDFTGLSFEMSYVLPDGHGSHLFRPDNRPLITLFKTLGIQNLRVGGNTADRPTLPTPTTADVDSLFAFARAAGVKVIYTLRLREGSLTADVAMADYITRHYGPLLDCFAIGNEPNVFSKAYAPYLAEWKRYAAQITAPGHSPGARFCGPSTSPGHEAWARNFAIEFGDHGPLALVSQHDYPGGDARRATNAAAARDRILSPAIDEHYAKFASTWVPATLSNGLPYRLEEANSFYDGGALDVSDTFASALWALDYQWWWAAQGAVGINFHTGDKVAARDESKPCRYAAFWSAASGYQVHPLAYALKMFSLGSRGRLLSVKVDGPDKLNVAVYAVAGDEGTKRVTLINREHGPEAPDFQVTVASGCPKARAEILFLTAPGKDVAAKSGVTLGGEEIQEDGRWDGKWTLLPPPDADGSFHFTLPPAAAALVEISQP